MNLVVDFLNKLSVDFKINAVCSNCNTTFREVSNTTTCKSIACRSRVHITKVFLLENCQYSHECDDTHNICGVVRYPG